MALARALVKRPKLLLLDEPLAALDRKLREGTRFEMVRLQEQLGLTFVMVTHDQEEAMSMATRLAVMNAGRIAQIGTPHEVYEHPASRFVADFIGIANILDAPGGGWMALRPEKITLSAARPDLPHTVAGKIVDVAYEGDRSLYRVATEANGTMVVSTTNIEPRRRRGPSPAASRSGWAGPTTPAARAGGVAHALRHRACPFSGSASSSCCRCALVLAIALGTNAPGLGAAGRTGLQPQELRAAVLRRSLSRGLAVLAAHRRDLDAGRPAAGLSRWPTPSPAPTRGGGRCC